MRPGFGFLSARGTFSTNALYAYSCHFISDVCFLCRTRLSVSLDSFEPVVSQSAHGFWCSILESALAASIMGFFPCRFLSTALDPIRCINIFLGSSWSDVCIYLFLFCLFL